MENYIKRLVGLNNDEVYNHFLERYHEDPLLCRHREYVELNRLGFGEKPFHAMWLEIVRELPENAKFLEIGVYKGQILSLIKLLSDAYHKNMSILGVTPLSQAGDKFSKYENCSYYHEIKGLFDNFHLDFSDKNLLVGLSTDPKIVYEMLNRRFFDLVYIDGSHDYNDVIHDIAVMKDITRKGAIVVFDDASSYKEFEQKLFKGHKDVADAIKDHMEDHPCFRELVCVGHNRVFKRIL